jgi:GT2 family glycosyltransferase
MSSPDSMHSTSKGSQPRPLVSAVVPLFNNVELSAAMVESLRRTLPDGPACEIILVDDYSSDGTRAWLETLRGKPGIRIFLNEKNLGFAATSNRGAREARGQYLALLNNDLLMEAGWLEPMLAVFEHKGERAGIVGNLQYRVEDGTLDHAGICLSRNAKLEHMKEAGKVDERRVLAVTGACVLLRTRDFFELGGFDEAFRNGAEDVDLCLKLDRHGKTAWVACRSRVMHHVGASRGRVSSNDERNSRLLFARWSPRLERELAALLEERGEARGEQALLLAGCALWREEARWRRVLDGIEGPQIKAQAEGFHLSAQGSPAYLRNHARVTLTAGYPVRNLFISGHLEESPAGAPPLGLRATLNGMQTLEWIPIKPGNFNLEIKEPAVLEFRTTELEIALLGAPWSKTLRTLGRLLGDLPHPSRLKQRLRDLGSDRTQKRLRIAKIVADDMTVVDWTR